MAARLEERTRALEVADRTRRQLLADVSHELSTPLSAIRGYVETLEMDDAKIDPAAKRRYLHIVTEEAERLEHIIGDLLDLARLEGGGVAFSDDEVSVAALFGRIRDRHAQTVSAKRIALETIGADAVPVVQGDANRLEQAVQNLVANAIRHTPEGGRVEVRAEAVDGAVRLAVTDTGPGIPEEHLPHIFDRFYKADASRAGTSVPSGSGLGLSIVQAIVERHGGSVTAANVAGGGARFEIALPARPAAAPAVDS
jgi:two-component system sensor histidine kinase BaeS